MYAPNAIAHQRAIVYVCGTVFLFCSLLFLLRIKKVDSSEAKAIKRERGRENARRDHDDDDDGDIQSNRSTSVRFTLYMVQVLSHVCYRPIMHRILVANCVCLFRF